MVIFRERHPATGIKAVSWQYNQLAVQFSKVAELFINKSMQEFAARFSMREVTSFLEVNTSEKEILSALNQIKKTIMKLKTVDTKFKLDRPVLNLLYQQELSLCESSIKLMKNSLNTIWDEGKPVKKDVPFAGTTTYKFVMKSMLKYMNDANALSGHINDKIKLFNRANKKLPPLPSLPLLTAPGWVKKI